MKRSKFTLPFLTFAAGLIAGIFLISLYSFSLKIPLSSVPPSNSKISVQTANEMFLRYYNSASSINAPLKGFSVNRDEFQAINTLFSQDETLRGCRIYLGKDNSNKDVRIVVGVNKNGVDVVTKGIYQTPSSFSSPCPPICDVASPITIN